MTDTMQTSEVLNRAADVIEERGWGDGGASMIGLGGDNGTGVCIMGALFAAQKGRLARFGEGDHETYDFVHSCGAGRALNDYLQLEDPDSQLWEWNDHGARHGDLTATGVIEALRACAVIEAARERQPGEVSA